MGILHLDCPTSVMARAVAQLIKDQTFYGLYENGNDHSKDEKYAFHVNKADVKNGVLEITLDNGNKFELHIKHAGRGSKASK